MSCPLPEKEEKTVRSDRVEGEGEGEPILDSRAFGKEKALATRFHALGPTPPFSTTNPPLREKLPTDGRDFGISQSSVAKKHARRSTVVGKDRMKLASLRISKNNTTTTALPYKFSDAGSFIEGDIHISPKGITIDSSPKSPQVEDTITRDELVISDSVLGRGASGFVKLAYHTKRNRQVAVKSVALDLSPSVRKKVLNELRILYNTDHPNVVSFYGGYLKEANIYLVLEYMNGGTMAECLKVRKRIPEFAVGKMAAYLLPALAYVHNHLKIVHRDIKPSNILLSSCGQVKLSDFGVSSEKLEDAKFAQAKTFTGTVTYMSPERVTGDGYASPADIWSFGVSLAECALGRFPFIRPGEDLVHKTFFDLLHRIQEESFILPDDYSSEFANFIELCLKKDPTERPSAAALLEHPWVQQFVDDTPTHFCRYVHQTQRMLGKPFSCSEACGDCAGSYVEDAFVLSSAAEIEMKEAKSE